MLHQICTSRIGNDNVCQGSKIASSDDNIHSFPYMVGEKVGNLSLYVSSTLQCNSCNGISKVSWVIVWSLHAGNVANEYLNHQWYDHLDIMKNV
jgi:hypothetical protein